MRALLSGRWFPVLLVFVLAGSLVMVVSPADDADAQSQTIEQVNESLGVGINLGNALEGPREGDWGITLQESFFPLIAEAGFGHVRVPIRFSAYADDAPPYTIPDGVDPSVPNANNLWERLDWVIAHAEANGLYVILDLHLYRELSADVAGERDRFLAIWEQIAIRYADAGPLVLFELLNEPQGEFNVDPGLLNTLIADALAIIRSTNPTRPVLVGPAQWNSIYSLDSLVLPNDPNLIVSVHFYDPFDFTHQGASWIEPVPAAPTSFEADLIGYGAGWQDWSWDTTTTASSGGLQVDFEAQWDGLAFGHPDLFDPATLTVTISGNAELAVRCADVDEVNFEVRRIVTTAAPTTFAIDLTSCPEETRAVNFMTRLPPSNQLLLADAELCEASGRCSNMIESGSVAIESAFDAAQAWGSANNRPMHVGEFGAYSAEGLASLAERAEWTEAVRLAGRSRGLSMSYWEFGAGFGAYDLAADMWVAPLVEALGVESTVIGDGYVALAPGRLLDTRAASQVGQYSSPWGPDQTRPLNIVNAAGSSVPSSASAVALHVTTVPPAGAVMAPISWLNAYPSDADAAVTAVHNFGAGDATSPLINDLVIVGLGSDGAINLSNQFGHVDLVIDVVGYFGSAGDRYLPTSGAVRIVDSRPSQQIGEFGTPWAASTRSVQVAGNGFAIPAEASAVAMHITTVNPAGNTMAPNSWLTVGPSGSSLSTSSVHNFGTSSVVRQLSNDLTITKIGVDGRIDISNAHGEVDLVIDVVGYFSNNPDGASYRPVAPVRVLDTRALGAPVAPGETVVISDPLLTDCAAVAMHVTTVGPAQEAIAEFSWLSPVSAGAQSAVHNFGSSAAGDELINDIVFGMVTGTGTNAGIAITNAHGYVDIVVDVVGLFSDGFASSGGCIG